MTKVAAMPNMVKTFKYIFTPEPVDRWPWNLVCSVRYMSTSKFVQMVTLG